VRITPKTKYVTNGRVFIKLGYYWQLYPHKKNNLTGYWWGCTCWPHYHKMQEVRYLHGLEKDGSGRIPFSWLVDNIYPPLMEGFIGIKRRLIPHHILAKLDQ